MKFFALAVVSIASIIAAAFGQSTFEVARTLVRVTLHLVFLFIAIVLDLGLIHGGTVGGRRTA